MIFDGVRSIYTSSSVNLDFGVGLCEDLELQTHRLVNLECSTHRNRVGTHLDLTFRLPEWRPRVLNPARISRSLRTSKEKNLFKLS